MIVSFVGSVTGTSILNQIEPKSKGKKVFRALKLEIHTQNILQCMQLVYCMSYQQTRKSILETS